ncbi:MAG: hypothetical protein QG670_1641 [Thermoproteota archaeon]|nr:hypothetical protein [Thermoproteota archaeon]
MSQDLCSDFIAIAERTWKLIDSSEKTHINISEESVTDLNLLELQSRHTSSEIITKKHPKGLESKTGADWEWWLGSNGSWLGLRVQAKKLNSNNLTYRNLDKWNTNGRQIDLLTKGSRSNRTPMIPLYVFYNYWNQTQFSPKWLCKTYPPNIEMLGCGLSHADFIKSVLNKKSRNLKDVSVSMYPWSCLVCCKGYSTDNFSLPFRAFHFLYGTFRDHIDQANSNSYDERRFIIEEAPPYVYKLIEGEDLTEDDWLNIDVSRIQIIREFK